MASFFLRVRSVSFYLFSISRNFITRSQLRAQIRGFSSLKKTGNLGLWRNLKSTLVDVPLPRITEASSSLFFGSASSNAELVVRQFLLQKFVHSNLYGAVLYSIGSNSDAIIPLPSIWRKHCIDYGLKVDLEASRFTWWLIVFLAYSSHIYKSLRFLLSLCVSRAHKLPLGRYAYLGDLNVINLPCKIYSVKGFDICSWYAHWGGRDSSITHIYHNVNHSAPPVNGLFVETLSAPFLLVRGFKNVLCLWNLFFRLTICASFDLLYGRWWTSLMIFEALLAKAVSLIPVELLALEYLFHFSGNIYRPLWTYEAESKGSSIIVYFYSTFEQPKLESGYESQNYEFGGASWPLYLVWDEYQAAQLRQYVREESQICVLEPILFSGSPVQFDLAPNSVAVFDVQAHRLSAHFPVSTLSEYINAHPDFASRFLLDVQKALAEHGLYMAYKGKRDIGSRYRKDYKKVLKEIYEASNVKVFEPNTSAYHIIQQCSAVISMPFTSTALLLREQNIPSIYYDPTGWIQRDDRAAHGIPVLIGANELRQWLHDIVNKNLSTHITLPDSFP